MYPSARAPRRAGRSAERGERSRLIGKTVGTRRVDFGFGIVHHNIVASRSRASIRRARRLTKPRVTSHALATFPSPSANPHVRRRHALLVASSLNHVCTQWCTVRSPRHTVSLDGFAHPSAASRQHTSAAVGSFPVRLIARRRCFPALSDAKTWRALAGRFSSRESLSFPAKRRQRGLVHRWIEHPGRVHSPHPPGDAYPVRSNTASASPVR